MSVITCDELIVSNRIIFSDNTTQDTSASAISLKCANIERNVTGQTTSILSDSLVVNNNCSVGVELVTNTLKSNVISFLSDLDENGDPREQSKSFTSGLRDNIIEAAQKLNSIIPDIIDPPSKKMKLQDNGYNIEVDPGFIFMNDPTKSCSFDPTQLRFDNNEGNTLMIQANQTLYFGSNYQLDSGTSDTILKLKNIGIGYRVTNAMNNYSITRTDNYVLMDDGVTSISLLDPNQYLDNNSLPGFSVIISNINGQDVDIEFQNASIYAHNSALTTSSPFTLKKYSTCSFTLVFSASLNGYFWSVSQF